MIKVEKDEMYIKGKRIDILFELSVIIKSMYETDIPSSIITDVICAMMKDSTDSLEIISALSNANLR